MVTASEVWGAVKWPEANSKIHMRQGREIQLESSLAEINHNKTLMKTTMMMYRKMPFSLVGSA